MEADGAIHFRPTLWPGTIVPPPPLRPYLGIEVDQDWITWPVPPELGDPVQLPDDFYMRELLQIRDGDLEAVATLYRSYGPWCDPGGDDLDRNARPWPDRTPDASHDPGSPWGTLGVIHRDLVMLHLKAAQESVTTWLSDQHEEGLVELVAPEVTKEYLARMREKMLAPEVESLLDLEKYFIRDRLRHLRVTMQAALSGFSIGIGELSDRNPTIYSVSFLQLYNHMAEGATIRRCANETCLRYFVRQRGRAEYGQYRTEGVKYCTRECARAQAQRELRRRRRKERLAPSAPSDEGVATLRSLQGS